MLTRTQTHTLQGSANTPHPLPFLLEQPMGRGYKHWPQDTRDGQWRHLHSLCSLVRPALCWCSANCWKIPSWKAAIGPLLISLLPTWCNVVVLELVLPMLWCVNVGYLAVVCGGEGVEGGKWFESVNVCMHNTRTHTSLCRCKPIKC